MHPKSIALAVLVLAGLQAPAYAAGSASDALTARMSYRDNLVACIGHGPRCDKRSLSQEDQEYLLYELKTQRFTPDTVEQVADVRMETYDTPVVTLKGVATGVPTAPTTSTAKAEDVGSPSSGVGGTVSQEMVEAGAGMLRKLLPSIN